MVFWLTAQHKYCHNKDLTFKQIQVLIESFHHHKFLMFLTWYIFKIFWCFLLICNPLFGPPGYLAFSIHFSILSNQWHPSKVVVVVHDSQHVPNMIGVIAIGFLFWTVMKKCMAKKVFPSPCLLTVGVKFHAPTPISVCY